MYKLMKQQQYLKLAIHLDNIYNSCVNNIAAYIKAPSQPVAAGNDEITVVTVVGTT